MLLLCYVVIRYHDQKQLKDERKKEFILAYGFRTIVSFLVGKACHGSKRKKLADHIFISTQEGEGKGVRR